jgi:pimeloyl-ACP methyl ester carboxylesterase
MYRAAMDARLGPEGRARVAALAGRIATATDPALRNAVRAEMGAIRMHAMTFDPEAADDETLEVDAAGHEETWSDALRLQADGVEPAAFSAIRAPAIMLHGEDDPHPGRATWELLRRWVPELEYEGFSRCGHEPWRERHAQEPFMVALRAWLAKR